MVFQYKKIVVRLVGAFRIQFYKLDNSWKKCNFFGIKSKIRCIFREKSKEQSMNGVDLVAGRLQSIIRNQIID